MVLSIRNKLSCVYSAAGFAALSSRCISMGDDAKREKNHYLRK
jgi:hypothetical protein